MENTGVRRNKFSLRSKAIVAKVPSLAECIVDLETNQESITKNDEKEHIVDKRSECNLPPLKLGEMVFKWQPIPSLAQILKNNEEHHVKENKNELRIKMSAKSDSSSLWVPLPKPCVKCIAHQYLNVRNVCGDEQLQKYRHDCEKIKAEIMENVKTRQLKQSKKRPASPQNYTNKKFKVEKKLPCNSSISGSAQRAVLDKCPLCSLVFVSSNQVEIDAHISECFSGTEEDEMW